MTPVLTPALDFSATSGRVVWRDTNALAHLQSISATLLPDGGRKEQLPWGNLDKGTLADLEACREFYRGNTNYPQPAKSGTAAGDILVALGKFDADLNELHEAAATRPYSRFPTTYDLEPSSALLRPQLSPRKRLSILVNLRTIAELEAGQTQDALADLQLGFRLSDSIRGEPILIDHLVRIATLTITLQGVREGLARHVWSQAQLSDIENQLASLNLLAEYKLAMRGERACSTGILDYTRRQGFRFRAELINEGLDGHKALSLMPGGWFYQNMLTISEILQEFNIPIVDEKTHRVFPDIADKSDAAVGKLLQRSGPYNHFARILMPALGAASRKSARMQTSVDAARVACALERYRLANGSLPETLDALAPRFIETIPTDLIDGKPLRYRLKPDGGYVLYSVGWNKTDDGGEIGWTKSKDPVVDITTGDWVWRYPAK
jgi:hypothetical protein